MKTVLFVDDNVLLGKISCEILTRHGYRAVLAHNGPDALRAYDQDPADIVITDMCMDGMDGLQLASALHEKNPRLPVLVVTAYDPVSSKDVLKCLPKDALFPELLKELREIVGPVPATKVS